MEFTALCIRLLMNVFMLLVAHVQQSYFQISVSDAAFRIVPTRLQLFEYESVSFLCEGFDVSVGLVVRNNKNISPYQCSQNTVMSTMNCTILYAYKSDSGEYWCEGGGKRSNTVNITVTDGSVILESPVLPVVEMDAVTLRCRDKTSSSLTADFYKDGLLMGNSATGMLTIHSVSKSDGGLYKCNTSDAGESPKGWLAVRVGSVTLDIPVLPVKEGSNVTLRCRKKSTSSCLTADFYKDGLLMKSSSTGEMIIHSVSKSDEGVFKCLISDGGESPERWLAVRVDSVILDSPVLPVTVGNNVTLRCRKKSTSSHLTADFYKDGLLMKSSSTGEMIIHSVSKSDEGLYKCLNSDGGESPESWLAVRALHSETWFSSDRFFFILLLLRTVFTIVLVPLLLLLVGLLHCGKLPVTHK